MYDTRNFRKEYDAFLQQFPHRTAVIEDIKVRYQYGGKENAPVLLFFNGLEMQEMWILWVSYLIQRQVGGDDQRLPAAISAVHDAVDLFQCVLGTTLHAEVVNNKQGIAAELVHDLISPGKAAVQLVQDSGKVRHTHRHLLLHQSVCNAPGKENFCRCPHRPREAIQGSLHAWSSTAPHSDVHGASAGCGHCRFQRSSPALPGQKTPQLLSAAQGRCAFAG